MRISYKINIQVYPDDTVEEIDARIDNSLSLARANLANQFVRYLEDLKIPGVTNF